MGKTNGRLETARVAYREALEAARVSPTPEHWAKLLAAGKELSAAQEMRGRGSRQSRRSAPVAITDLVDGSGDGAAAEAEPAEQPELE